MSSVEVAATKLFENTDPSHTLKTQESATTANSSCAGDHPKLTPSHSDEMLMQDILNETTIPEKVADPPTDEVGKAVLEAPSNPHNALPILQNLCRTSVGQRKVATAGGIEAIIATARSAYAQDVQVLALNALEAAVMLNPEFQQRASEAGASVILLTLVAEHDRSVVCAACKTMAVLAYRCLTACSALAEADAPETLLRALQRYPHDKEVQQAACGALYRLACDEGDARDKVKACIDLKEAIEHAATSGFADDAHWFRMKSHEIWPNS